MGLRNLSRVMPFSLILLVMLSILTLPLVSPAQQMPDYKLIAPELAAQGESFKGIVVDPEGKPLAKGNKVVVQEVFAGRVVEEKTVDVKEDGEIEIPAIQNVGNNFITLRIIKAGETTPSATVSQHVEVLKVNSNLPTKIAKTSEIITPAGYYGVRGQGLKVLEKAALKHKDGTEIPLKQVACSSLECVFQVPENIPKGEHHLVASTTDGESYEAPNTSKNPSLRNIKGDEVRYVGQEGKIIAESDTKNVCWQAIGGEANIEILNPLVCAEDERTKLIWEFIARAVGVYTLHFRPFSKEDFVPRELIYAKTLPEPINASYDPNRDKTKVTCPFKVVDDKGNPLANVPVHTALSHPGGLEYDKPTTDKDGRATFIQTLPGDVPRTDISFYVWKVPGYAWKQDVPKKDGCGCLDLSVKLIGEPGVTVTAGKRTAEAWGKKEVISTTTITVQIPYEYNMRCESLKNKKCESLIYVVVEKAIDVEVIEREYDPIKKAFEEKQHWERKDSQYESKLKDRTITCEGRCDGNEHKRRAVAVYSATFDTTKIKGELTFDFAPLFTCKNKEGWTMVLVFDENKLNKERSDYDGDGVANIDPKDPKKSDADPFDPTVKTKLDLEKKIKEKKKK